MSIELRKVPFNWVHPQTRTGHLPLIYGSYSDDLTEWARLKDKWDSGIRYDPDLGWRPVTDYPPESFEDYYQARPVEAEYVPEWRESELTHIMMYENVSKGTPLSPVFAGSEALAHWLADNNVETPEGRELSYTDWLRVCEVDLATLLATRAGKRQKEERESN